MHTLALFDLDNTLLTGDSEVLWADYLVSRNVLDNGFAQRNAEMDRRYQAGEAAPGDFCEFFASTFEGRSPAEWAPVRAAFMDEVIRPRISEAARELVQQHRDRGDLLVLTSATSRFLVELTAVELGFEHVIAFFYSDSINDLPLLLAVGQPVVVDPDARLAVEAQQRHWPVLRLARGHPSSSA
jgi:phosphoserine phosphatase